MKVNRLGGYLVVGIVGGTAALGASKLFEPEQKNAERVIIQDSTRPVPVQQVNMRGVFPEGDSDFTFAAASTVNSVVHVTTQYNSTYSNDPLMDFFWGPGGSRGSRPQIATGSGVIISPEGYIVTNNHVIDDADKIEITLNNNKSYEAKLIGADPSSDLALLKIDGEDLPAISFGNSDEVQVGQWVLAVGNPFNLTSTVTAGIVSAKARDIDLLQYNASEDIFPLESFIQTDAAVNPGNSGGALVNSSGELIGINTAIASRTGSYAGYSFAVPSAIVKKVTDDLLEYGIVQRGFIGVALESIDQSVADSKNLPNTNGILVTGLAIDGAAMDAGVKEGDVILKIGNLKVNSVPALQEQVGKFRPGDEVSLNVRRDGKFINIPIVLRNKEGNTSVIKKEEINNLKALGATFKRVSAAELNNLNLKSGVRVVQVGPGKFKSAGIEEGLIITKIDQKSVGTAEELVAYLKTKEGGILLEGVTSSGMKRYYGFGL